jgi:hypothetical protein
MLRARSVRRAALLILCLALLPLGPSWAQEADIPGPIHAGNTFGWYPTAWRDEFIGPLKSVWHKRGTGGVYTKNGMFTMTAGRHGDVSAKLDMSGHATGRWEIRWKARERRSGRGHYTLRTELVPAGDRKQYCGARDVAIESYTMAHPRMKFYINNLPDLAFRATKGPTYAGYSHDHWHTFAVEVTPSRISWFVDAKVIRSERRPEALSGVPFTVQLSMDPVPGVRMHPATMQLDWMRYWTLAKPNDKSVAAPQTTLGHYRKACPPPA